MAYHIIALDKAIGVFPVVIRCIIHRLLSKLLLLVTGTNSTEACNNINLCSILGSSIELYIHATLLYYRKTRFPLPAYQALLARLAASDEGGVG